MADEFVKQTKKYLTARKDKKDEPFFLYFSSQDIHVPRAPHKRFHGKSQLGFRGDAMVALDWAAGEIINSLEENGLAKNTIVIFSSDNGPVYDDGYDDGTTVHTSTKESDRGHDGSGPYRGGKYQIYEGGTRVPLIIRWPGKIEAGRVSPAMVNQIDFTASFAEMLGVELADDESIDSRSTLDAFLGRSEKGLEVMLEEARGLAVRKGDWKFIRGAKAKARKGKKPKKPDARDQLYKLDTDVGEQNNLAKEKPEITAELKALLEKMANAEGGIRAL
jgi:arylsulfatase A